MRMSCGASLQANYCHRLTPSIASTGSSPHCDIAKCRCAQTYCLCTDESVVGTAFYLMEHVDGRVLWDPTLPGMDPFERRAIFGEMNRVIAALHRVDYEAAGLSDFGRPGNYLARQIDRWSRQYRASATETIEAMDRLIEWLPVNIPQGDATAIVHGDFRLDNMIFHSTEPRILAVLDWELSTLGHPMADFAYHMMTWRLSGDEFRGLRGSDFAALGIPNESAYLAVYLERTGADAAAHRKSGASTSLTTCSAWQAYFRV